MHRSYRELRQLSTFEERFEYLSLKGQPGMATFGHDRWMNQNFYTSKEWRDLRYHIVVRDGNLDLGVEGFDIHESSVIHHIIPITPEDLVTGNPLVMDPNNLITTTHNTHNAIHYGDKSLLRLPPVERTPGDTRLW